MSKIYKLMTAYFTRYGRGCFIAVHIVGVRGLIQVRRCGRTIRRLLPMHSCWTNCSQCVCCLCCTGESLVPEQTNEVEENERRADGSRQGDRTAQTGHDRTSPAVSQSTSTLGLPLHHCYGKTSPHVTSLCSSRKPENSIQ